MKWQLLIILLVLVPLATARVTPTEPQETSLNTFSLVLVFSEPVEILGGTDTFLDPLVSATDIRPDSITNPSGDKVTWKFRFGESPNPVPVGEYMFYTKYKIANNDAIWSYNIELTVTPPPPPAFEITLKNPKYGFNNGYPPFDVTVNTSRAAECKWDYNVGAPLYSSMKPTTVSNGGFDHTFTVVSTNPYRDYVVVCVDPLDIDNPASEVFTLGYFVGKSNITRAVQIPEVVEDNRNPRARVDVSLDGLAKCILWDGSNPDAGTMYNNLVNNLGDLSNHSTAHSFDICFSQDYCNPGDYEVNAAFTVDDAELHVYPTYVICSNLAQQVDGKQVNLSLNYSDDPRVRLDRPKDFETEQRVPISVISSLVLSQCNYAITGDATEAGYLARITDRNFSTGLPLEDGEYSVTVNCDGAFPETQTRTADFIVDRIPPSNLQATINTNVCLNGSLNVVWQAQDTTSGLAGVEYNILKGSTKILSGTKQANSFNILLNQPLGNYKIELYALDNAGLKSEKVSYDFQIKDSDDVSCDLINPRADAGSTTQDDSILYWVLCSDDESGCKTEYSYNLYPGTSRSNAVCTYNKTADIATIYEIDYPSILCYNVSDNAGNSVSNTYKLDFGADDELPHCQNGITDGDETDVDCGGSCGLCEEDQACEEHSDCETDYCSDDNICEVLECDDDEDCNDNSYCSEDNICERYDLDELCNDGRKNGDETDVDCGGSCGACEEDDRCDVDEDCETLYCSPNNRCEWNECDEDDDCEDEQFCSAEGLCLNEDDFPSHCSNGERDRGETDVDCGGEDCDLCEVNDECDEDSDCVTDFCSQDDVCIEIPCVEDDDCEIGQVCTDDLICKRDRTTGPTHCTNNKKDSDETGIDCGGSCRDCATNDECTTNDDCNTGYCNSNKVCEDSPYECIYDWDCDGADEICNAQFLCQKVSNRPQNPSTPETPTNTTPDLTEEEGFNWTSMILIIFGIVLIGGGGYMYMMPPASTAKPSSSGSMPGSSLSSGKPELELTKRKTLDPSDVKKVKELREKLSKKKTGKLRKSLMSEFDSKTNSDKEIPPGVERLKEDLIPQLQKPIEKKELPVVKKSEPEKTTAKTVDKKPKKKTDDYIPIEKLKGKKKEKDLFDELEDI